MMDSSWHTRPLTSSIRCRDFFDGLNLVLVISLIVRTFYVSEVLSFEGFFR